jgi:hypothetical protein
MAFVHNPERGSSDLVILAAQDFTGEPVATVHLPVRILGALMARLRTRSQSIGSPFGPHFVSAFRSSAVV